MAKRKNHIFDKKFSGQVSNANGQLKGKKKKFIMREVK